MMDKTTLSTIYKQYLESEQEKYHCTEEEFKNVCYLLNQKIVDRMLDGEKYKLPARLGVLSIAKNKMKFNKLHFDYAQYNKTGIKAYHLNEHSDNYYAFVRWSKINCNVTNKYFYGFKFTRTNSRRLAAVMKKENGHQLYEIANRKDAV